MLLLAIKLKNMFPRDYICKLENISINGDKRGCDGFIQYNGRTVYVNTEGLWGQYLVRTAKDDKDYRGGCNQWVNPDRLVAAVKEMLTTKNPDFYTRPTYVPKGLLEPVTATYPTDRV